MSMKKTIDGLEFEMILTIRGYEITYPCVKGNVPTFAICYVQSINDVEKTCIEKAKYYNDALLLLKNEHKKIIEYGWIDKNPPVSEVSKVYNISL